MNKTALHGIKVLDFGWAIVGSLTGKQLADYGAEVIRVESAKRLDLLRGNRRAPKSAVNNPDDKPGFSFLNTSKMGITVDLKNPRAHEVIDKLIRWADVVIENFTPGTLSRLGFGYDFIKTIKPDIIMASGSGYGQTGPLAQEWGVNGTANASSGRFHLSGWPDREGVEPTNGVYGDAVLPLLIASAIIAAVDYKRRTGIGQHIDASMLELCVHQISPALLDWQANACSQTRCGNRIPNASPHGVFPCIGEDRWCAITVFTEEEWRSFCHVLGDPAWVKESRFSDLLSRKENEDELEEKIGEWTIQHTAEEIMQQMQAAGVAAGVVQNAQEIIEQDPQFKEREYLTPIEHPVLGTFPHPKPPYKLTKTPAQIRTSPCLGEHTEYICTQLLGISDEEFIALLNSCVFI